MILPNGVMLLGVNMLFVAAVLYIIALNLQGKVGLKETAAMCILTGLVNNISGFYNGFAMGDTATMAASFLFGFTYWLFAFNILTKTETYTGLGNYCLFVVLTAIAYFIVNIQSGAWVLAVFWFLWGQLWAAFWVANGLKKNLGAFLAFDTYIVAIINFLVALAFIFGWMTPKGFVN
ncbi:MAG: AmiS/UreI family transporter [Caldiserica bacterium]|nr:AmiS/UreI family transporter [Caldisericota bacterium]